MKGKQLFMLFGTLVMAGSLLAGCGSGNASQSATDSNTGSNSGSTSANTSGGSVSSSSGSTASNANSSSPGKTVKITFWNAYNAQDDEEKTIVNKVIPAFEKANPNIQVQNVTLPYSDMKSKLLTSAAGGELPDVARLDIIWVAQLAKLGTLLPEDKLVHFNDLSTKVFAGPLSTSLYQGQHYGLPLDTNTKVLFANTAVLSGKGITEPPKTMDDFISDIKKVTSGSGKNKVYGYILPGVSLWQLVPWIYSYGGAVLSPDGKTAQGYLNGPGSVQAISTLVDLFKQGYITGLLPGASGDMDGLGHGQYAMLDEGPWDVPTMQKTYPNVKYTMSLFPAGPGGSKEVVGGEDISVFKSDSEHQQAAWKFEQFMMQPEVQGWMQATGQMSTLIDLPAADATGAKYFDVFRQQLQNAVARPVIPTFDEVNTDIQNAVTTAAQNKSTVQAALDKAVKQIDVLLK